MMGLQPLFEGLRFSIGQQVDGNPLFEINEDRSIASPSAKGRVRGAMLPSPPPLRTVQVDFSTYSSSLSFRPSDRTRFLHVYMLAMNLLMTGWVKQPAVLYSV